MAVLPQNGNVMAGIFDTLGIVSPVTVTAKIIFEEMCRLKID